MDHSKIEKGVRLILQGMDCDLKDSNFFETPERFARAMVEMFDPDEVEYNTFEETHSDFVMLRNHTIWSMCPHHLLPVEMIVSLAYIPNGKVLGLSKLARLLHDVNRGPLLQERFIHDVLSKVKEVLPSSYGAACIVSGSHHCAKIRGVKTGGSFITYKKTGTFETDPMLESRFFELARHRAADR